MRADQRSAAACQLRREFWQVRGLVHIEPRLPALLLSRSQFCVGAGAVIQRNAGPAISHFRNDLAKNHAARAPVTPPRGPEWASPPPSMHYTRRQQEYTPK